MLKTTKSRLAALASVAAMAFSVGIAPASAQAQPVVTGGLVNVTLVDVADVNNTNIQIPIGVAANVGACVDLDNVQVGVLSAQQILSAGDLECTITGDNEFAQIPVAFQRQAF